MICWTSPSDEAKYIFWRCNSGISEIADRFAVIYIYIFQSLFLQLEREIYCMIKSYKRGSIVCTKKMNKEKKERKKRKKIKKRKESRRK